MSMSEKLGHRLPDDREEPSAHRKLEVLLETLEALKSESHDEIPDDIRQSAILANEQRIRELKAQHPELNN